MEREGDLLEAIITRKLIAWVEVFPTNNRRCSDSGCNNPFCQFSHSVSVTNDWQLFCRWDCRSGGHEAFFFIFVNYPNGHSIDHSCDHRTLCSQLPLAPSDFYIVLELHIYSESTYLQGSLRTASQTVREPTHPGFVRSFVVQWPSAGRYPAIHTAQSPMSSETSSSCLPEKLYMTALDEDRLWWDVREVIGNFYGSVASTASMYL